MAAAVEGGDPAAGAIMRAAGRWLGVGLASWGPLYAPELVLLAGGVAAAGNDWFEAAVGTMREVGLPFFVETIRVRRAVLGNRAGVIGAALAALHHLSQ